MFRQLPPDMILIVALFGGAATAALLAQASQGTFFLSYVIVLCVEKNGCLPGVPLQSCIVSWKIRFYGEAFVKMRGASLTQRRIAIVLNPCFVTSTLYALSNII